jgi:hypothetical protein
MSAVSIGDDAFAIFEDFRRDESVDMCGFIVKLAQDGMVAEIPIDATCSDPVDFFRALADQWRGWEGAIEWHSLEGDLTLSAETDRCGHVVIRVEIGPAFREHAWSARVFARVDAGQLDRLHRQAQIFFDRLV